MLLNQSQSCLERERGRTVLTETLAHPDADHVELEQSVVDFLALLDVHEEMIDKAAAPGRHGAENVTE